ncbi:MAG TPA: PrsW family intramembrane metalloprotease [Candidatus Limnocylindrales bacterium]|nr:PrsW family intramembrane metalloprotease [Candidatus Limnocylindrales bacterium]
MRPRYGLALLLAAPAFVWTFDLLTATPPLILAAATLPALVAAALIVAVQWPARRPLRLLAAAFAWGAIGAAFLATSSNEIARAWMNVPAGDAGRLVMATLIAPVLEESAKACGLVLLWMLAPHALRTAGDGVVYGVLIGIGFVCTENFLYLGISMLQGGQAGVTSALYMRGVLSSAAHATFTACSGAGLGASMQRAGKVSAVAAAGLLAAVLQHAVWNGIAAPALVDTVCGTADAAACAAGAAEVWRIPAATVVAAAFLAPGIALVSALSGRTGWRRRR